MTKGENSAKDPQMGGHPKIIQLLSSLFVVDVVNIGNLEKYEC